MCTYYIFSAILLLYGGKYMKRKNRIIMIIYIILVILIIFNIVLLIKNIHTTNILKDFYTQFQIK